MPLRAAWLLLLAAACPDPDKEPPRQPDGGCFVGDTAQPGQLEAVALDASLHLVALHDGDSVQLQRPPQGGYVIYAGAAARNLDMCGLLQRAFLIDPSTGNALTSFSERSLNLVDPRDAWYWPSSRNTETLIPNIPACPDFLHVGVVGKQAILHVEATDVTGRKATVEVKVTPICNGEAACPCICGPNPSSC